MTGDGGVPVTGVIEITLEQSDLAAAEEFYAGVLGFPVVERWADETVWVMAADRTRIGLWRPQIGLGGGRGGGHVHDAMGSPADSYGGLLERLRVGRPLYAAAAVDVEVRKDAEQPGAQIRPGLERAPAAEGARVGVLNEILRALARAAQRPRRAIQTVEMVTQPVGIKPTPSGP